jgi:hypothetical protein
MANKQYQDLFKILKERFEKNMIRHKGLEWSKIQSKLEANPKKLVSLSKMEETGGEPDVLAYDKASDTYIFYDCSLESPKVRRSLCYDTEALNSRKENKPKNSALAMAAEMGVDLLNEQISLFTRIWQF